MQRKHSHLLTVVLLLSLLPLAQPLAAAPEAISAVSAYGFIQSAGSYTPITGGTVHGTGASVDFQNYNAVNIGFTFTYDGVAYTQVGINADGFVRMGGTDFINQCNSEPISNIDTTNCSNLVSALGMDLIGRDDGELRSETTGVAPNRVFTVQWTNFRHYDLTSDRYNFQIKLHESSNQVEFVYGGFIKNTSVRNPQVGLKGATNADFSNRTGANWAASTAGGTNTAAMTLHDDAKPATGQTYTWLALANDVGVTAITAPANSCFLGSAESVVITIRNSGYTTQASIPVAYRVNGGPWVTETWTGSLAPFATVSYAFAATVNLSASGTYTIDARTNLAGDGNPSNDQSSKTVVTAVVSSFPYTESFESGPAGWASGGTNSSWELGAPNDTVINGAYAGTQAWTTGLTTDYKTNEESYVTSLCFNFAGLSAPRISLGVWWQTEFQWDGANLQYTTDGVTWHMVGAFGDLINWYNSAIDSGLAWSGSEESWTGRNSSGNGSGGWLLASHGLAALAGTSKVQFRIAFGSGSDTVDDGFAFDGVSIFEDTAPPGCAVIGSPANGATDVSVNADLSWMAGAVGTPTSYDVYFGANLTPPFVANVAGSPYDPGLLPYHTTHYWQIVPKNAYGSGAGCPVWSFTTWADPTVGVFPYSQDFDGVTAPALPAGWTRVDSNGDSKQWETSTLLRRGVSGNGVRVNYNDSLAMDDWLFTPPLRLTAGVTYGVRFFYRASGYLEKMEVKWGASNSPAGMTEGPIFNDPNINFTIAKEAIATFTPSANGVYYVGFHGYSLADQLFLVVDDVTIYDTADSTWQWRGNTSADWFTKSNWEGSIVPGELDEVQIPTVTTAASANALSTQASSPTIGSSSEASYGRVKDLTIASGAALGLATTHNLKVGGTLTNNGTLSQTRSVSTVGSSTVFMNIKNVAGDTEKYFGVSIKPTSSALGNVAVAVHGNQQCAGITNTVKRCYDITPATPAAADISFYFSEPEMTPTGQPLAKQNCWNYHSGGWNLVTRGGDSGTCNSDAIGCWVQGTGISVYSPFALGPAAPTALKLVSFDTKATAPWPAGLAMLALAGLAVLAAAVGMRRREREL